MQIELPWPDRRLSPNARLHWRKLMGLKRVAKHDAYWQTMADTTAEERKEVASWEGNIPIAIHFHPPDRRHRDDDNAISAFKACRDGIAQALGVNDRRFRPSYHMEEPLPPKGLVRVILEGP